MITKIALSQMLKGGIIMDVSSVEEAQIAEQSGACAVMALDKIPADIRKEGGVARMAGLQLILDIKKSVSIPVMAKCRIGHRIEAQILQQAGVDFIDESEVLTPADRKDHINKRDFQIPFVCGARNLGEALRRLQEGATMIRTKGEAGTGDISQATKHLKNIQGEINYFRELEIHNLTEKDLVGKKAGRPTMHNDRVPASIMDFLKKEKVYNLELFLDTIRHGRLPCVNFAAGGIATPADAALMMQLGMDGVFVGSGIFKSPQPVEMASAMVQSVTHYEDPAILYKCCMASGPGMKGIDTAQLEEKDWLQNR